MTRKELYSHLTPHSSLVDHMEIMVSAFRSLQGRFPPDGFQEQFSARGVNVSSNSVQGASISPWSPQASGREKRGDTIFAKHSKQQLLDEVFRDGPEELQIRHLDYTESNFPVNDPSIINKRFLTDAIQKLTQSMKEELQEEVKRECETEIKQRDLKIAVLEQRVVQLQKSLKATTAEIENRDYRLSLLENCSYDGTMVWKISEFSGQMADTQSGKFNSVFSLPFYSSRYGYKLCLRLYIMGDGIGKDTHMSLFFVVMKGEYDNILTWPFAHRVTFRLINQKTGRDIVDAFQPDPLSSSFKKPISNMNIASGCPRFISHESLMNGGYIVDDVIFIKCIVR